MWTILVAIIFVVLAVIAGVSIIAASILVNSQDDDSTA